MKPTSEQTDALGKFLTGGSLKIEACAGAGKTTTLKMLARATHRSGLYLAFNRDIAKEAAASFPKHVECRTGHSLAYSAHGRDYQSQGRLRSNVNARVMLESLGALEYMGGHDEHALFSRLLRGISKFCASARTQPSLLDLGDLDPEHEIDSLLMTHGESWLEVLWEQMSSKDASAPTTHDVYLKVWALSRPKCPAEFVLFDEAQDGNPVLLDLLALWERRDGAQIVAVGDRYQQIYSWRGAINAMERYETTHTSRLTQSFRYGEPIAALARTILSGLRGAHVPIRGTDQAARVIADFDEANPDTLPDAVLTRTNAVAMSEVIALHERGIAVAVAGGVGDLISLLRGADALRRGRPTKRAELVGYANWSELVDASEHEDGAHLRVLVRMVEEYDLGELIELLEKVKLVKDPEVTVSTAHRSKGLEWDHVRLASDFRVPKTQDDGSIRVPDEEAHLLYVAVTRARQTCDVSACPLARYALSLEHDGEDNPPVTHTDPESPAHGDTPSTQDPRRAGLLERLEALAVRRGLGANDLLDELLEREELRHGEFTQCTLF